MDIDFYSILERFWDPPSFHFPNSAAQRELVKVHQHSPSAQRFVQANTRVARRAQHVVIAKVHLAHRASRGLRHSQAASAHGGSVRFALG